MDEQSVIHTAPPRKQLSELLILIAEQADVLRFFGLGLCGRTVFTVRKEKKSLPFPPILHADDKIYFAGIVPAERHSSAPKDVFTAF